MSNKEKLELFEKITVQEILDFLEGKIVSYRLKTEELGCINYRSDKAHYVVFDKKKISGVFLSNLSLLDNNKPFYTEYIRWKNYYWSEISKNAIKKCESLDDMKKMIIKRLYRYICFKLCFNRWDYICVHNIISNDKNAYSHDVLDKIMTITTKISETKMLLEKLQKERKSLVEYQKIHEELFCIGQKK